GLGEIDRGTIAPPLQRSGEGASRTGLEVGDFEALADQLAFMVAKLGFEGAGMGVPRIGIEAVPPAAEVRLAHAGTSASQAWMAETTTDPSPTPEATRLVEPARTSPTAKIPGRSVA